MKIQLNSIIRLSNDEKFIVLNELVENNRYFYLTMGIINDTEVDSSKVVILEQISDDEGYYIEKIIDSELLMHLTKLFKEQL